MIKVKSEIISKVICFGSLQTRRYEYYCPGRIDFNPMNPEPVAYPVARIRCKDGLVEIVGLFNSKGERL